MRPDFAAANGVELGGLHAAVEAGRAASPEWLRQRRAEGEDHGEVW